MEAKASGQEISLSNAAVGLWRQATDVAHLCREIVMNTAVDIVGRKYVKVEGWTAIAVAHGFIAGIRSVEETDKGIKAVAELRRQSDGVVITTAEGYVGKDEVVWFGGMGTKWNKIKRCDEPHMFDKRNDYAIRAMAQTRGISRVCRSAFSHVVLLIDKGLSTVPAEEVAIDVDTVEPGSTNFDGKIDETQQSGKSSTAAPAAGKPVEVPRDDVIALRKQFEGGLWQKVKVHFGKNGPNGENAVAMNKPQGLTLGELTPKSAKWFIDDYHPQPFKGKISQDDLLLRAACDVMAVELNEKS